MMQTNYLDTGQCLVDLSTRKILKSILIYFLNAKQMGSMDLEKPNYNDNNIIGSGINNNTR